MAKKELEKIDLRKELKRKERALAAEEEELVKARTEITKFRNAHITQIYQVSNVQIQNNKDVNIRVLEEENEELKRVRGATKTPDKKRKLADSRGSSTDRDYSTPRSDRNEVHRREKPTQIGQATEPRINPSLSGQVTEPRINPSPSGQVTEPRENPTQSGQVTEPRSRPSHSGQVTETSITPSQSGHVTGSGQN